MATPAKVPEPPAKLEALRGPALRAALGSVRIDEAADPVSAASALREAAAAGLTTYVLPVEFIERDGQSALQLGDGADALLDYFRGVGPAPATSTTSPAVTGDG